MKKKTIILLLLMTLVFTVSCGKDKEEDTDTETTEQVDDDDDEDVDKKDDVKEEPKENEVAPKEDPFVEESKEAYMKFIEGKLKATAKDIDMLDDGEYTFDEFVDNKALNLKDSILPDSISEGSYAFIDCGMDGNPELALKLYYIDSNEAGSPYTDYTVIKYDGNDQLRIVTSEHTYYRGESEINEYGYITSGGSSGAASYYTEEAFINAEGKRILILSDSCEMGLPDLTVPQDCLSTTLEKKLSHDYGEYGDYQIHCYFLEDHEPLKYDSNTWEQDYTAYVCARIYTFTDDDGNIVEADKDYVNLCRDNGIRLFNKDEFEKLMEKHYEDIGFDNKIKTGKDITWTETSVADRVSKKAQIQAFIDNSDMWYLDPSKVDQGNEVAYVITDLNRNGRYELIRSERLNNNPDNRQFCRNRFFEISEDYRSIYKMEYENETKWANGELSGWSHDLLSCDRSEIDCYWDENFGSASENFTIKYFYVIPTIMDNSYGLMENKMVLAADGSNKITSSFSVGMAYLSANTYTDEEGIDCSKEAYEDAQNISFPTKDGWTHDKVYILYEQLDDNNIGSWKDALTESANAYFYSTVYQ